MPRRTEHKLRNQRASGGARPQRRSAHSQIIDQQAGERANPGADDGYHEPLGHGSYCSARRLPCGRQRSLTVIPAPTTAIMSLLAMVPIVVRGAFHAAGNAPSPLRLGLDVVDGYLRAGGGAGTSGSPVMYCFSSGCRSLRRRRGSSSFAAWVVFRGLVWAFWGCACFGW